MNQRRLFRLLLVIPPVVVFLVGAVWFVGRGGAPPRAAQVFVAATAPGHVLFRARVVGLRDRGLAIRSLDVAATLQSASGEVRRLYGRTDEDGFVDFEFWLPPAWGEPELSLDADGEVLLSKQGMGFEATRVLLPKVTQTVVHLKPDGPHVALEVRHGALTVPVADDLRVTWDTNAAATERWPSVITLELEGASGAAAERRIELSSGQWKRITPFDHIAEVTLQMYRGSQVSMGFAVLPMVPGAIAARLVGAETVKVISPVPRSQAHVAIASVGRVYALKRLELTRTLSEDAAPSFQAMFTIPKEAVDAMAQEAVWAVTSSEADFASEARVGWPLNELGEGRITRFDWARTFDSFGEQQAHHATWLRDLRVRTWFGLLAAGFIELTALCVLVRRAPAVDGLEAAPAGRSWIWIVVFCVALGFAGLGSMFVFW